MAEEKVELYIYDLSQGMAKAMSPMLLGKQIDGVWHTSVVIGGVEHFFGQGVQRAVPCSTPFGNPLQKLDIGHTGLDKSTRDDLLADLSQRFQPQHYNLLKHNCNHFSHEFCQLLCGNGIPTWIVDQADQVLNTPMGEMLMPMILQMEGQTGSATATGFGAPAPRGGGAK